MKLPPKIWAATILLGMAACPPWQRDGQWLLERTGQRASLAMDCGLDRWYFGFQPQYRPLWSRSNIASSRVVRVEWQRHAMYRLQSQKWSIDWILLGLQGLPLGLLLRRA